MDSCLKCPYGSGAGSICPSGEAGLSCVPGFLEAGVLPKEEHPGFAAVFRHQQPGVVWCLVPEAAGTWISVPRIVLLSKAKGEWQGSSGSSWKSGVPGLSSPGAAQVIAQVFT